MATIPTTLVVFSEDKVHFPIKSALVVMKQLFLYGVKEITEKGDKIFISLTYSPRASTLKKKFGTLPVSYMRTKIENKEEFKILEKVVKRYKFNLPDEEEEADVYGLEESSEPKRKKFTPVIAASTSTSLTQPQVRLEADEGVVVDGDIINLYN